MTTASDLRRLALALDGTSAAPHFDRTAFKVARTYVTLAADGKTANFKFTPDEQALKCTVAADAFAPVPNAWGKQGWTTATLSKARGINTASTNRSSSRVSVVLPPPDRPTMPTRTPCSMCSEKRSKSRGA